MLIMAPKRGLVSSQELPRHSAVSMVTPGKQRESGRAGGPNESCTGADLQLDREDKQPLSPFDSQSLAWYYQTSRTLKRPAPAE